MHYIMLRTYESEKICFERNLVRMIPERDGILAYKYNGGNALN